MKLPSLCPWLQTTPPLLKGVLFFGLEEQLILYRIKFLQNYYAKQGFQIVRTESADEVLDHLSHCQSLFESSANKKCIIYQSASDTLANNQDFISTLLNSPHIVLLSSEKLNSRAKLVILFQSLKETAVVPCYDIDLTELSQSVSACACELSLKLNPLAQQHLTDMLSYHLGEFFSILEMLALYRGTQTLEKSDIDTLLKEFSSFRFEDFNHYFFLADVQALNILLDRIESSEWISVLRQILNELMILISLQIHRVDPSYLKDFWRKGIVKFSYGRIELYQKCLKNWPLKRCGFVLEQLLTLEVGLKTSPPPSLTDIHRFLTNLVNNQIKTSTHL